MRNFILLLLLIIFSSHSEVNAQKSAVSVKLDELYSMLPLDCKSRISKTNDNTSNCFINGQPLRIKTIFNDEGKLYHLGIDIFPLEDILSLQTEVLYFVERTLLEYLLVNNGPVIIKKAREEKIELSLNGNKLGESRFNNINQILPFISGDVKFKITQDSLFYFAGFVQPAGIFQIRFPANNYTITGMDKKEYGEHIASLLMNYVPKNDFVHELPRAENLKPYKDQIMVSVGDSYFKSITSCKYYIKDDGHISLLFTDRYPLESFSNAFLVPFDGNKNIELQINHKVYGNEVLNYKILLNDFLSCFEKDFESYFGIEESSEENTVGTLILYNRGMNFINLLRVRINTSIFFGERSTVTANFYTNIPSDNIKSLFSEFNPLYSK